MSLVNLPVATGFTILIIIVLFVIFMVQRYVINLRSEDVKARTIFVVYLTYLFLIAFAIVTILHLWDYNIANYFQDLGLDLSIVLEDSIPKLVGTLVVMFVALLILKVSKITMGRVGSKESPNQRRKRTIAKITLSVVKYIIVIIAFLATLSVWGVNVAPALAGLGIAGLVIGLGAQKFINDLISGFFIIFENHFNVGDWIEINGFMGEVTDIGLKTTKVKNFKGEVRIFNNGGIDPVSNFSQHPALAIVDFAIAYKEDVRKTIEVLTKDLPGFENDHPEVLETPRILGVTSLADSGVNMRAVIKTQSMTQWGIERALRQRIKEILDTHDIEIPFPQVTVHYPKDKKQS